MGILFLKKNLKGTEVLVPFENVQFYNLMLSSGDLQLNYKQKRRLGFLPVIHIYTTVICHRKLYRGSESAVSEVKKTS